MALDRNQDKWLQRIMGAQTSSDAVSGDCLDADIVAAWADGALSTKEIAAAELHASACARCQSLIAAMARTAPAAVEPRAAWTPGRLVRWLAPLAAAAAAVAIWVIVPDRPITEMQRTSSREEAALPQAAPMTEPPLEADSKSFAPEPRIADSERGPRPSELEARRSGARSPSANKSLQKSVDAPPRDVLRDARRDEAPANAPADTAAASTSARSRALQGPASAAKSPEAPANVFQSAEPSALNETIAPIESASASDPLARWRVTSGTLVERSTDGGSSWARTSSPITTTGQERARGKPSSAPATLIAIQALDASRATVTTSDGRRFSTSDAGATWTLVQEKPAAPF